VLRLKCCASELTPPGLGANDVLSQMTIGGARAALIPDIQGSILASVDSSTGAFTKQNYLPYGKSASAGITGTFGYTGQRIDAETGGLYYYRARMYHPAWGRFMQVDPLGALPGPDLPQASAKGTGNRPNLYVYVGNDPLNGVDPTGQAEEEEEPLFLTGPPAGTYQPWSGTINAATVPEGGMTAYRVWGGGTQQAGSWLSPIPIESSSAARSLLALPDTNTAQFISTVQIPAGSLIQYGTAAEANSQLGGGVQIWLPQRIPTYSYGPGTLLPP